MLSDASRVQRLPGRFVRTSYGGPGVGLISLSLLQFQHRVPTFSFPTWKKMLLGEKMHHATRRASRCFGLTRPRRHIVADL